MSVNSLRELAVSELAVQRYIQKTEPARNRLRYERERKGTKEKRRFAAKTAKENERFLLASSKLEGTQTEA